MLQIRISDEHDFEVVKAFYCTLIDAMQQAEYKPGWEWNVYPTQKFLLESIDSKELYIAEENSELIACMVVNHAYNDGYRQIKWQVDVADEELLVIHALGAHSGFSRKGIGKKMVQRAIDEAETNQIKTIRLDVLVGNLPAEKLYTKLGFVYIDTIQMYYEDTGWTYFKVYEYVLSEM